MSITKRYIIFDKIDKEEEMAQFREKLAYNLLIQDIKNPFYSLNIHTGENSNEIDDYALLVSIQD